MRFLFALIWCYLMWPRVNVALIIWAVCVCVWFVDESACIHQTFIRSIHAHVYACFNKCSKWTVSIRFGFSFRNIHFNQFLTNSIFSSHFLRIFKINFVHFFCHKNPHRTRFYLQCHKVNCAEFSGNWYTRIWKNHTATCTNRNSGSIYYELTATQTMNEWDSINRGCRWKF